MLVWNRIRIRGSMPLTNGSGSILLTNGSGSRGGPKTYGSGFGPGSATLIFRFRTVKLRGRSEAADRIRELIDYEEFCGTAANDKDNTGLHILRKQIISYTQHYVFPYSYSQCCVSGSGMNNPDHISESLGTIFFG
jgi:hypothetical protein